MKIQLESFVPYRLSVLSNRISQGIAETYSGHHDLRISDWRVLAILGRFRDSTATELCERGAMDKVTVSRATRRMLDRSLISRTQDPRDRRSATLSLTEAGQQVHDQVAPQALAYESRLLACLDAEEIRQLDSLLTRLGQAAERIAIESPDAPRDSVAS